MHSPPTTLSAARLFHRLRKYEPSLQDYQTSRRAVAYIRQHATILATRFGGFRFLVLLKWILSDCILKITVEKEKSRLRYDPVIKYPTDFTDAKNQLSKMTSAVLLEARPFRPFKSSEEYLYAMKEDLAEWLQTMYPHLNILVENFMEKLETGVALCEHANAVKAQAQEYAEKKQAKKVMTRSVTGSLAIAQALVRIAEVKYFNTAKPGTFFARDNVSNFINWCKSSLKIIECLLFESDDLIMRKNEKHVILCLLEVARRGARFGMLAPVLVQMERQIDREIAADQKKLGVNFNENLNNQNGLDDDSDSDLEDEETVLMYGPAPQIITNDLKSLDEMVRDLVEKCTCPTQFPMIRVSEGKYRIGDTKVLIFVRILRNHVMVRVGGGWDTLAHYLDKHDPCRCRSQHRTTQSAKLVNKPGAADLHGSHVYYDRTPATNPELSTFSNGPLSGPQCLGPPVNALGRSRSRSPSKRPLSPNNLSRRSLAPPQMRSRSPTPNYTSNLVTKLSTTRSPQHKNYGPQSLPIANPKPKSVVSSLHIPVDSKLLKTEISLHVNDTDHSDTTSEVSDEGYRSLGIIQDKSKQRSSLYSQTSADDAEEAEHQVYTEDDLNEFGLRKTHFSQRIYENDTKSKLERNLPSMEKLLEPELQQQDDCILQMQKENSFLKTKVADGNLRRKSSSRTNSAERNKEVQTLMKKAAQSKRPESKISTWSGRPRSTRASLTADTFVSPFARNSSGRRSVSAADRRASSANTSPTKGKLKQDVLQAVQKTNDDEAIAQQLQELLKKYGSLNTLNDEDDFRGPQFTRITPNRMSYRSPRKDPRHENNLSRIPAPVL